MVQTMNNQWRQFLDSQPHGRTDSPGPETACAIMALSHFGLIRATGEDADKFLQGQFTNDVREVDENRFQMNSHCTPKGRMLANFLVLRHAEGLLLQMPLETHELLMKQLPKFILMSKVRIEDATDSLVCMGVAGPAAETVMGRHIKALPDEPGTLVREGGVTLMRMPGEMPRFELLGDVEAVIEWWKALSPEATVTASDYWSLLDIRAGIPTIYRSTSETFIPQMTNMQLIDGVSFIKGCYTGQEVVARMRYLGKLKRRMYLASADTNSCPKPGDELFSDASSSGQWTGKVVDAQPSPNGGCELLSVLEITAFEQDNVHLESPSGPKLQFESLPYAFEQE